MMKVDIPMFWVRVGVEISRNPCVFRLRLSHRSSIMTSSQPDKYNQLSKDEKPHLAKVRSQARQSAQRHRCQGWSTAKCGLKEDKYSSWVNSGSGIHYKNDSLSAPQCVEREEVQI